MQTMKIKLVRLLLAVFVLSPLLTFAQRGKDGNYTVTATNTVVNSYTYLTSNANAGATSITVNSNTLSGGAFSGNLAAGDLIMIIQMQGASMDINTTPVVSWGGNYTVPNSYWPTWGTNPWEWGQVTAINNAGKYEQVEVLSVSGSNTINLSCGLQNSYVSAGHVQIVRVPRFNDLTLNASTTIVPTTWGGQVGGVVALEVNGNLVLNASSKVTASGRGFRGAVADNVGSIGTTTQHTNGNGNGATQLGSTAGSEGGRKGEGVGGYTTEYDALYSRYGRGAPANGGGGGGYQNAGGGGGSNVGSGTYSGKGVPSTTFAASTWNLELAGFAGTTSPGGGRGGYSLSSSDQNELTLKPNSTAWGGDARKENGGLGGHPLTYDATRLFMGGGGGAGDQDQSQGGAGGNGGGIVHITCYGTISGTGSIEADGAVGQNTNPLNQGTSGIPSTSNKKGNDGAGGGGGGGAIYIKNATALPAGVSLLARGGNGGNQVLTIGLGASWEASGTGGAGGGGSIAFTSGTPTQSVAGGTAGTTNSIHVSNFNVNGGTNGAAGIASSPTTIYNITTTNATVCAGATAALTASVTGTSPGTLSWYTQQFGGSAVATGNSYTPTPAPATTTTYWVGVCPGTFRVPVTLTVNPKPTIAGTAVLTNPSCSTPGSITGLTVSGGTPGYTYSWSGTTTAGPDYTNIAAGTYTLTVTDLNGCTDTDGPHTLVGVAGPIIDASAIAIQNESCNGTLGAITGITATGVATLTYSWSNGGGSNLNASNLSAGSYTLTVTDGNGCTATSGPHTISYLAGPSVNAAGIVITPATCGNANGAISGITATGTGLSYAWNGTASATAALSGQNGGNYTLVVTDVNGCTASSGPHTIPSIAGPTINSASVAVVNENCNLGNGSISGITVSGGTPAYTIAWSGTSQTTLNISNLSAGSYTLTVTDQNLCTATAGPFTVSNLGAPVINAAAVVVQDQSCTGTMGSITGITASGTPTLTYSWSNGGGSNLNASNLAAGSYTLTVTDGNGCTATSGPHVVGFIAGPTVNAGGIVITPATCGNANGAISGITATGTGLSYAWNGTASASTSLSGQNGGNYTLVVTDVNGCTASTGPHTIPSISGPTINSTAVAIVNESCSLANGSISGITVSGGTPAYTISWSGTTQTTLNLSNLAAGAYTLTVTDQNLCTVTAGPFTVINQAAPVINATAAVIQPQSCTGTLGSITGITVTGTPTLTYFWTNGGGMNLDATNLVAGSYTLNVIDGNTCTASSGPYVVGNITGPTVDASGIAITPATCGNANGAISGITATGTGLSYTWNGTSSASTSLSGQNGGNYTLVVTDVNGCTASTGPHTIPSIAGPTISTTAMTITPENCNQSNGSIVGITVSGGTPGYTYAWSGTTQTTLNISTLNAGVYTLTVTDQNLCTATAGPFTVNNVGGPSIDETNAVSTNVLCDGTLGTISGITGTGTALTYSWSNGGGSSLNASNLTPGSYVLTITDGNGCSITSSTYTIDAAIPMSIDATNMVVTQTSCTSNTGSISGIVVNGGINPVNSWSNSATTLNISNLAAGNYTLTVTDDQGCTDDLTVAITMVNAPVINTTAMVITDEHCGQNDASVSGITVSAGTPAYTYSWNTVPVTTTLDLVDVSSGTLTLTVTDAQGCSDAETITINETSGPVVDATNITVTQLTCTTSGSINGLVVNGVSPYTYAWTGTTQTTLDIVGLAVGDYTLTVTDANGCASQYGPTTLTQPAGPTAAFTWSPEVPDVNENVAITNTSTGNNNVNYLWSIDGQSFSTEDANYTFTAEGEYPVTLLITDAAGCIDSVTQIISIYGVLVIPNVMTINGDNVNETFKIEGLKPNTNLLIVNRWGNLVFQTDDYQNDWDGKDYSGNDLTEGVYTYLLKGTDGKEEHGFIHLIR